MGKKYTSDCGNENARPPAGRNSKTGANSPDLNNPFGKTSEIGETIRYKAN
jgi:hypothetical protein